MKLFTINTSFVSRSEAKRLLMSLDKKFKHIILDYSGVEGVGQAFADEVYRVFKHSHPEITVESVNQNSEVQFMIDRVAR